MTSLINNTKLNRIKIFKVLTKNKQFSKNLRYLLFFIKYYNEKKEEGQFFLDMTHSGPKNINSSVENIGWNSKNQINNVNKLSSAGINRSTEDSDDSNSENSRLKGKLYC